MILSLIGDVPFRLVFDGVVIITLDCKKDTDNVTLNFDGLTLDTADVTITGPSGNDLQWQII